jgi:hypothetical protein
VGIKTKFLKLLCWFFGTIQEKSFRLYFHIVSPALQSLLGR